MRALARQQAPSADGWLLAGIALLVRSLVVAMAAARFPPTDDGRFYHVVAERIARGLGYTWLWPDGAVTYAAHYPIGYPALMGAAYAFFGAFPLVAMLLNAVLGAASVFAVHRLASSSASRLGAFVAAALIALHPSLVLYTPALMTEGVASAMIVVGAWLAARAARGGIGALVLAGVVLGACVLVRPQLVLAVPLIGLLAAPRDVPWRARARHGLLVTALAVLVCLPWTARNCEKLESCTFVSANGGWNLLIGTARGGKGGWVPLETIGVPPECREVFAEAAKDQCFGRAALRRIAEQPLAWLALVPSKLMMTFEHSGAAAYYLHASNREVFDDSDKRLLGIVEIVSTRVLVALALVGLASIPGRRARVRRALVFFGAACLLLPLAWVAYLALVSSALLLGRDLLRQPAACALAAVVATTALTHAVFFGAGRYALVTVSIIGAVVGSIWSLGSPADGPAVNADRRGF